MSMTVIYTSHALSSQVRSTSISGSQQQQHNHRNVNNKIQQNDVIPRKIRPAWIESTTTSAERIDTTRSLSPPLPPFPNGVCGGKIIEISSSELGMTNRNIFQQSSSNIILPPRPIQVWLPKSYITSTNSHHPVLYVHDGQNAMEDSSSWTGSSWRLTGALTRLDERNLLSKPILLDSTNTNTEALPIVVLLPSSEGDLLLPGMRRRHLEYADLSNPIAIAHADFVATQLKPYIDARFRTLSHVEYTYAMGTSLGGQASMNLLLRHGNVFGAAACLSPCFQPATLASVVQDLGIHTLKLNKDQHQDSNKSNLKLHKKRIYIDNGGDVDDVKVPLFDVMDHVSSRHWWNPGYWWLDTQLQPSVDVMLMALEQLKQNNILDFQWIRIPGARHNERAWAWRIDKPLLYLFGHKTATTTTNRAK